MPAFKLELKLNLLLLWLLCLVVSCPLSVARGSCQNAVLRVVAAAVFHPLGRG
jgi:hypothetical protein